MPYKPPPHKHLYQHYINYLNQNVQLLVPNHRQSVWDKIWAIEAEFDKPWILVLADFARAGYSHTFTMRSLDLCEMTFKYLLPLFKYKARPGLQRPHMKGNQRNAKYPPLPANCPVSRSTVLSRLRLGWTWEQAITRPKVKPDINRIRQQQLAKLKQTSQLAYVAEQHKLYKHHKPSWLRNLEGTPRV